MPVDRVRDGCERLAEYVDEHGISDEELKTIIIKRFYDANIRRNRDYTGFMDTLSKPQFMVLTNSAVLYHMLLMKQVMRMQREVAAAFDSLDADEDDEVSVFKALTGGVRLVEFDLKHSRKDV